MASMTDGIDVLFCIAWLVFSVMSIELATKEGSSALTEGVKIS